MKLHPIHRMASQGIRLLGPWTSICLLLVCCMVGRLYFATAAINTSGPQRLARESNIQLLQIQRIQTSAAFLELSVLKQDWEMTRSATRQLSNDHRAWLQSQNELHDAKGSRFRARQDQESIGERLDRVSPQFSLIDQAIKDLMLVSESVLRRAPYIDQYATDRIASATTSIEEHAPAYTETMSEIAEMYKLRADRAVSSAITRTHRSLLLIGGSVLLLVLTGFLPKIMRNNATIRDLWARLEHAERADQWRWTQLGALGACFAAPIRMLKASAASLSVGHTDPRATLEHAHLVGSAADEIQVMIEDLLDYSAVTSDTLRIDAEPVDPRSILQAIEQRFMPIVQQQGLTLRISIDESCPSVIQTDPVRLQQILVRVVENAIAYTQQGSIEICAELVTREDQDLLMIRVVDTGCGIHQDELSRVFEPFQRADNAHNPRAHGVGLGLTVARSMSRYLGGDLTIESAVGAGSFVSIMIDIGNPALSLIKAGSSDVVDPMNQDSADRVHSVAA